MKEIFYYYKTPYKGVYSIDYNWYHLHDLPLYESYRLSINYSLDIKFIISTIVQISLEDLEKFLKNNFHLNKKRTKRFYFTNIKDAQNAVDYLNSLVLALHMSYLNKA